MNHKNSTNRSHNSRKKNFADLPPTNKPITLIKSLACIFCISHRFLSRLPTNCGFNLCYSQWCLMPWFTQYFDISDHYHIIWALHFRARHALSHHRYIEYWSYFVLYEVKLPNFHYRTAKTTRTSKTHKRVSCSQTVSQLANWREIL